MGKALYLYQSNGGLKTSSEILPEREISKRAKYNKMQARRIAYERVTGKVLEEGITCKEIKSRITEDIYGKPTWGHYKKTYESLLRETVDIEVVNTYVGRVVPPFVSIFKK